MRAYLIREREFNDDYVETFIKQYRRTLSFARLDEANPIACVDEDDTIRGSANDPEDAATKPDNTMNVSPPTPSAVASNLGIFPVSPVAEGGALDLNVPLRGGARIFLRVPGVLSKDQFRQFESYLQWLKQTIVSEPGASADDSDEG
jgi:hypothetical protein